LHNKATRHKRGGPPRVHENLRIAMSAAADAVVVEDVVGEDVDRPRALIVADDEDDGEPGSKRFKGTRKSGRIWRTRQKEP
jgi:hypothetical protein